MDASVGAAGLGGQLAMVTGASSGIGAATAKLLAAAGAEVMLVARREGLLAEVGSAIGAAGGSAVAVPADLAESTAAAAVAERVRATGRPLDVLVHSAGLYRRGAFAEAPISDFDEQWRINVRAPYALTQALLPSLAPGARIVLVTSVAGVTGMPDRVAYCTTKAAAEMLTKALAVELAPRGMRVNSVAPGFIGTPMNERLRDDPEFVTGIEALTPAGRLGRPEEVSAAVLFLASRASEFVHGQCIGVDGGYPTPAWPATASS